MRAYMDVFTACLEQWVSFSSVLLVSFKIVASSKVADLYFIAKVVDIFLFFWSFLLSYETIIYEVFWYLFSVDYSSSYMIQAGIVA